MSNSTDRTVYMLTTVDNPFNPFEQFIEWYNFDVQAGHGTSSLLARITRSSDELSDRDQALEIDHAMNEIVQENVHGVHRKVSAASWPLSADS